MTVYLQLINRQISPRKDDGGEECDAQPRRNLSFTCILQSTRSLPRIPDPTAISPGEVGLGESDWLMWEFISSRTMYPAFCGSVFSRDDRVLLGSSRVLTVVQENRFHNVKML